MTKIVIPIEAATGPSGSLFDLVNNVGNLYNEVTKIPDSVNFTMDDVGASPDQKLVINESNILSILATGGDISAYLFGIRAPISSALIDVPVGVPLRTNILGEVKLFKDWFLPGAEVWQNSSLGEIIYYNNPNPSGSPDLLASEAELIRQIDISAYSFLTISEVETIVAGSGWIKL